MNGNMPILIWISLTRWSTAWTCFGGTHFRLCIVTCCWFRIVTYRRFCCPTRCLINHRSCWYHRPRLSCHRWSSIVWRCRRSINGDIPRCAWLLITVRQRTVWTWRNTLLSLALINNGLLTFCLLASILTVQGTRRHLSLVYGSWSIWLATNSSCRLLLIVGVPALTFVILITLPNQLTGSRIGTAIRYWCRFLIIRSQILTLIALATLNRWRSTAWWQIHRLIWPGVIFIPLRITWPTVAWGRLTINRTTGGCCLTRVVITWITLLTFINSRALTIA